MLFATLSTINAKSTKIGREVTQFNYLSPPPQKILTRRPILLLHFFCSLNIESASSAFSTLLSLPSPVTAKYPSIPFKKKRTRWSLTEKLISVSTRLDVRKTRTTNNCLPSDCFADY